MRAQRASLGIALDSGYTTGRVVTDRTRKWETAVANNDTGEPILGEFLNLFAVTYLQELDSSRKITGRTMKLLDTNHTAEIMVGVDLVIAYSFGIPRTTTVGGLTMDMDRNIAVVLSQDGDHRKARRFQMLDGMNSSALEHEIFEKVLSEPALPVQAVSAVKALQLATAQGIPVHRIDPANLPTILPILQIGNDIKTDIQNAVANGWHAVVSERRVQLNRWNGVGYILLNPATGEGYYRISGGLNGGSLTQYIENLQRGIKRGLFTPELAKAYILAYGKRIWFPMPVDGSVGRGWGWTKDWDSDRQTYKWVFHQGIDIPADCGSAVIAVAGGADAICTPEASSGGYGNVVVVDHGLGVKTRYAHNSKLLVCGRSVAEGETIAESGNTGRVDSPRPTGAPCRGGHVHFEILIDNFAVDPEKMFDIRWRVP